MKRKVANPYRAVRQLERKLFLGVPERPESTLERDGNNSVLDRLTGRSLQSGRLSTISLSGGQKIATTIYRPKSEEVVYVRSGSSSKKQRKNR